MKKIFAFLAIVGLSLTSAIAANALTLFSYSVNIGGVNPGSGQDPINPFPASGGSSITVDGDGSSQIEIIPPSSFTTGLVCDPPGTDIVLFNPRAVFFGGPTPDVYSITETYYLTIKDDATGFWDTIVLSPTLNVTITPGQANNQSLVYPGGSFPQSINLGGVPYAVTLPPALYSGMGGPPAAGGPGEFGAAIVHVQCLPEPGTVAMLVAFGLSGGVLTVRRRLKK
jgi:hypothetical protein